jgi:hypothetical protein
VAGLGLGFWSGLSALLQGTSAAYEPMVALTSVTVVGLVWYTYFTRQTLEHARQSRVQDENRHRESMATAMLAEMHGLTARLKNLSSHGPSAGTAEFISHPMLLVAASNPTHFSLHTLQALTATLRRLRDVQEFLAKYPSLERSSKDQSISATARQSAEDERATTYLGIRARAAWAYNWAIRLVQQLQNEGGAMPVGLSEKAVGLFESVPLLPDPFDRAGDD